MTVRVRLFAMLRERAGSESVEVEIPEGATVADAIEALGLQAGLGDLLERLPVAAAVNLEYAPRETALARGDELALIPPVSGGAPSTDALQAAVQASVGPEPISIDDLCRAVGRPGAGAIVCFQGTTRDVERLDYEAYEEMAERRIARILIECAERHGLEATAAAHRVGSVPLGEASVVVAVSAAHREEAFAGAREAIDRIKAEVPIWKREIDRGEARWVDGTPPEGLA
jgi:MoaE-MoaD fusion protein